MFACGNPADTPDSPASPIPVTLAHANHSASQLTNERIIIFSIFPPLRSFSSVDNRFAKFFSISKHFETIVFVVHGYTLVQKQIKVTIDQSEVCTEMISDKGWLQILSS